MIIMVMSPLGAEAVEATAQLVSQVVQPRPEPSEASLLGPPLSVYLACCVIFPLWREFPDGQTCCSLWGALVLLPSLFRLTGWQPALWEIHLSKAIWVGRAGGDTDRNCLEIRVHCG